jgi:hypothetical protein
MPGRPLRRGASRVGIRGLDFLLAVRSGEGNGDVPGLMNADEPRATRICLVHRLDSFASAAAGGPDTAAFAIFNMLWRRNPLFG